MRGTPVIRPPSRALRFGRAGGAPGGTVGGGSLAPGRRNAVAGSCRRRASQRRGPAPAASWMNWPLTNGVSTRGSLRPLPAERDRVVCPLDVDPVPQREHDQDPDVTPAHARVTRPETLQQPACRLPVHPLVGLSLVQQLVGETVGVALQPVT